MFPSVEQQLLQLSAEITRLSQVIAKKPDWPAGLSNREAEQYLGLGASEFRALVNAGRVRAYVRSGNRRRVFRRVDLDELLARLVDGADPTKDMDFGED